MESYSESSLCDRDEVTTVCATEDAEVTTVPAAEDDELTPVQKLLVSAHHDLATAHSSDQSEINKLPEHALIKIFAYSMNNAEEQEGKNHDDILLRIRLVCKRWFLLARDSEIWKDTVVDTTVVSAPKMLSMFYYGIGIRRCIFACNSTGSKFCNFTMPMSFTAFEAILPYAKNLRYFEMIVTDAEIENLNNIVQLLSESIQQLQELVLVYDPEKVSLDPSVSIFLTWNHKFPNLKSLRLSGRKLFNVTDDTLKGVADNCKNLTQLNLDFNNRLTNKGVGYIAKQLAGLKKLSLMNTDVADSCLETIAANCKYLEELSFGTPNVFKVSGVNHILSETSAFADSIKVVRFISLRVNSRGFRLDTHSRVYQRLVRHRNFHFSAPITSYVDSVRKNKRNAKNPTGTPPGNTRARAQLASIRALNIARNNTRNNINPQLSIPPICQPDL